MILIEGPPGSARPGCCARSADAPRRPGCWWPAAANWRRNTGSALCGSCSNRSSPEPPPTRRRSSPARPATSREVFTAQADSGQTGDTLFGVLHGLYWLTAGLAADQATGHHRRRRAMVRRRIAAAAGIPRAPAGGSAGRCCAHPAHRRAARARGDAGRDRLGAKHSGRHPETAESFRSIGAGAGQSRRPAGRGLHRCLPRSTGGNPLLLRQLLKALESDGIKPTSSNADTVRAIGSRAVSSLVLRRFARMPADNRAVARAIAIIGDGASLQLVAELTGLPTERVAESFGALARAEVLRHEYPLAFVHPLVHDAVYGDIPLGAREMQHEKAARLLADAGAAAEQIAAHLLKIPGRGDEATVNGAAGGGRPQCRSRRAGRSRDVPQTRARRAGRRAPGTAGVPGTRPGGNHDRRPGCRRPPDRRLPTAHRPPRAGARRGHARPGGAVRRHPRAFPGDRRVDHRRGRGRLRRRTPMAAGDLADQLAYAPARGTDRPATGGGWRRAGRAQSGHHAGLGDHAHRHRSATRDRSRDVRSGRRRARRRRPGLHGHGGPQRAGGRRGGARGPVGRRAGHGVPQGQPVRGAGRPGLGRIHPLDARRTRRGLGMAAQLHRAERSVGRASRSARPTPMRS